MLIAITDTTIMTTKRLNTIILQTITIIKLTGIGGGEVVSGLAEYELPLTNVDPLLSAAVSIVAGSSSINEDSKN